MGIGATLSSPPPVPQPPRLLDQVRGAACQHGHTEPAASAIADWCRGFIRFHGKRHPRSWVSTRWGNSWSLCAQTEKDPVRSLAASRQALEFLYQDVLHIHLGELPLPRPPRLLDQVRQVLRMRHYSAAHGGVLRAVDRALHSFPQQAASARHGGGGGDAVPAKKKGRGSFLFRKALYVRMLHNQNDSRPLFSWIQTGPRSAVALLALKGRRGERVSF